MKVGLDERGAVPDVEAIGELDDRLGLLTAARTRQSFFLLGEFQLVAEPAGCNTEPAAVLVGLSIDEAAFLVEVVVDVGVDCGER